MGCPMIRIRDEMQWFVRVSFDAQLEAELSIALAFSLSRHATGIDRRVGNGETVIRSQTMGISLSEKTVGIVGMGDMYIQNARKWRSVCSANNIGCGPVVPKEAWADISRKRIDTLQGLLPEADVVTLRVPLLPTTRGLIGEEELSLMKRNPILVNTARGRLVDEKVSGCWRRSKRGSYVAQYSMQWRSSR
ncbi:uncharacterized protein J7T54_005157 [Emericellopsis cladophorae]|uniref:D-isomer specific 2-hydroxyacid dehydrogenase NAD-binding domain-containing protein n=1 Tax=Emericellopsis cladophorae TaxID=2686198 RepID=A0A9P9Y1U5_9HYPO|nr:uncharacterized protein J7T54_005157 [Emericellopsis cladophorae]KAI6781946.1 hypothetical protein J7T54_005157 [Emericellopsis cladophorae]